MDNEIIIKPRPVIIECKFLTSSTQISWNTTQEIHVKKILMPHVNALSSYLMRWYNS